MSAHLIKSAHGPSGTWKAICQFAEEKAELINEMTGEKKVSQGKVRALATVSGVCGGGEVVGLPVNHRYRHVFLWWSSKVDLCP